MQSNRSSEEKLAAAFFVALLLLALAVDFEDGGREPIEELMVEDSRENFNGASLPLAAFE